jgi:hypothetical protein
MKKRTVQQMIDPYDIPSTEASTVYVEEYDNITEEIELTLEQLQEAYNMKESLKRKIWSKKRIKNVRR